MRRIVPLSIVLLALLLGTAVLYRRDLASLRRGADQGRERVVALPAAEAHRLLAQAGLPPLVFDGQDIALEVAASDPAAVAWILKDGGAETMRFTATLRPLSERATAVTLTLRGASEGRFADAGKRLDDQPSIKTLYLAAMDERVASTLERRPYRAEATYPAVAAAALANVGSLASGMEAAGAAWRRRDEAAVAKAYADEAAGRFPLPAPRSTP